MTVRLEEGTSFSPDSNSSILLSLGMLHELVIMAKTNHFGIIVYPGSVKSKIRGQSLVRP